MEILYPGGSKEHVENAIKSKANAVYGGFQLFNARNKAKNFTTNELVEAINKCHENGLKFYLTLNTLMLDEDIEKVIHILKNINVKPDAFISADIGLCQKLKEEFPDVELHASTQFGISNIKDAQFAEKFGFKRVILAREMTEKEIELVTNNINIDSEVFVWGTQCVSFSGSCFLGSLMNGGTANRGKCITLCRDKYLFNDAGEMGNYLYVPDLNCINSAKKGKAISLKIEGRRRPVAQLNDVVKEIKGELKPNEEKGFYLGENLEKNHLFERVNNRQKFAFKHNKNFPLKKEDVWIYENNGEFYYISKDTILQNECFYLYSEWKLPFKENLKNVSMEINQKNGIVQSIMFLNYKGEAKHFYLKNHEDKYKSIELLKDLYKILNINIYSIKFKKENENQDILISVQMFEEIEKYILKLSKAERNFSYMSSALKKVYVETENLNLAYELSSEEIPIIVNLETFEMFEKLEINRFKDKEKTIFKLPFFNFRNKDMSNYLKKIEGFGVMLTKFSQIEDVNKFKFGKIFVDYLVPVWNHHSREFLEKLGIKNFCASPELSFEENMNIFEDANEVCLLLGGKPTCVYSRQCFKKAISCLTGITSNKNIKNIDRDIDFELNCYADHRTMNYKTNILNPYNCKKENVSYRFVERGMSIQDIKQILTMVKNDSYYENLLKVDLFKNSFSNMLEEDKRIEN